MDTNDGPDMWIREVHRGMVGLSFKVEKTLFSEKSAFQRVDLVKTRGHGIMLLNDGVIMLSERDEFVYHEMIAHVPLFVHPDPRQVLVIGGGDGGTVREVLKHRTVEKVVLVEIDELVIRACRDHLPSVSCALDDPRLEILIGNGVDYVLHTDRKFDVVLVDSTDPIGPATPLFNRPFYEGVAALLTSDGIMISQAESPFYDHNVQESMLKNQRLFFEKLHLYLFPTLTYPGGLWSFAYASKGLCPVRDFDPGRFARSAVSTKYYNAGVHRSSFTLPVFLSEQFGDILNTPDW